MTTKHNGNIDRVRLKIPLSEQDTRALKVGDLVSLDGLVFTGAQLFHQRVMEGILPPIAFKSANVLLHAGPIMRQVGDRRRLLALTPTSSIKFELYIAEIIRKLSLRAVLGKTTVGHASMREMEVSGCVHLTRIGTPDNVLVHQTKEVVAVYFEKELGIAEATLLLDVENFGPFIVDIDTHGNNLYCELEKHTNRRLKELYSHFGIPEDFSYTDTALIGDQKDCLNSR